MEDSMRELNRNIQELKGEIVQLQTQSNQTTNEELKISTTNLVTAKQETLNLYLKQLIAKQGSATTQGNILYYGATASIHDCKQSKGLRASMFKCAQNCHALQSLEGLDKSIYYAEGSKDLTVSLLFREIRDAEEFHNKLTNFAIDHTHFASKLVICPEILNVALPATKQLDRVMYNQYISADNKESPLMSLNDVLSESTSVASNQDDPSLSVQALENPTTITAFRSKWYKCHLISKQVKEFAGDPDNFIFASWLFHQQFDGLNTDDDVGVAVKFDDFGDVEEVQLGNGRYERRQKVNVILEFRYADVAAAFSGLLKKGTERMSDTEYRSFIYAKNGATMKYCLDRKYQETVGLWGRSESEDEDHDR